MIVNGKAYAGMAAVESAMARKQMQLYVANKTKRELVSQIPYMATLPTDKRKLFYRAYGINEQTRNMRRSEILGMQSAMEERNSQIRTIYTGLGAERRKGRIASPKVLERARKMHVFGKWGKVGRDAMLLRNAGTAISSTLGLSGLIGGVKAAGSALLSFATGPIGLTAIAVGALGFGIYKLINAHNEEKERIEQLNRSISEIATNGLSRFYEALKPVGETVIEGLKNINVGVATINVQEEQKNNRVLSNIKELKPLLDLLDLPMSGNKFKDVKDDTIQSFWQYIAQMNGVMPNLPKTPKDFVKDHGSALAYTIGAYAGNEALKDTKFKDAQAAISEYAQQLYSGKIKFDEYQKKINEIAAPFNPDKYNLFKIGGDLSRAKLVRNSDLSTTYEWYEAQYNSLLNNLRPGNMTRASAEAAYAISSKKLAPGTPEWWNEISKIVASKEAYWGQNKEGEDITFPFPVKDGRIDLANLSQQLKIRKVELVNPLDQYVNMLSSIYRGLSTDQAFAQYLKGVTEGQFIAHLLTNNDAIVKMKDLDFAKQEQDKIFQDTVMNVPRLDITKIPGFNVAPNGFYRNDILNSLRGLGIDTNGIYNQKELQGEPFNPNNILPKSFSQKPYSSQYTDTTKTEIKPVIIKIDKIEANATMKEEIDVNQLASLIKEKSIEAIGDLSTNPIRLWG